MGQVKTTKYLQNVEDKGVILRRRREGEDFSHLNRDITRVYFAAAGAAGIGRFAASVRSIRRPASDRAFNLKMNASDLHDPMR